MAIFQNVNIGFKLDKLRLLEYSDRFGGMVEPYVISIFFKVDGERYRAILDIVGSDVVAFGVQTDPPSQPPVIAFPPGPILRNLPIVPTKRPDGTIVHEGETVVYEMDMSHIEYKTTLQPIPLTIRVAGQDLADILNDAAELPLIGEILDDEFVEIVNLGFDLFDPAWEFLSESLEVDVEPDACPEIEINLGDGAFVNRIEAQFDCLIPGTVGGVFFAMENDSLDENDVATIRATLREEIEKTIKGIISEISIENPWPEADESAVDEGALLMDIFLDLLFRWDPVFLLQIWFGWDFLFGGFDDKIDYMLQQYDHRDINTPSNEFSSEELQEAGGGNRWKLLGKLDVL